MPEHSRGSGKRWQGSLVPFLFTVIRKGTPVTYRILFSKCLTKVPKTRTYKEGLCPIGPGTPDCFLLEGSRENVPSPHCQEVRGSGPSPGPFPGNGCDWTECECGAGGVQPELAGAVACEMCTLGAEQDEKEDRGAEPEYQAGAARLEAMAHFQAVRSNSSSRNHFQCPGL